MTLEDVRSVLLAGVVGQGFFVCVTLFYIWQELKKQTALLREARDFVKNKAKPPVMHADQPKVEYRY